MGDEGAELGGLCTCTDQRLEGMLPGGCLATEVQASGPGSA